MINVTDELNAYKVFETLNARGVRLSSTDLLKNYLFSVLHRGHERDDEMKALEDRWEAMVSRLGSESFPDFLRTHWISRKSFVRQSELFKTIRARVNNREAVFGLLRDMEQDMDAYLGLTNPEASNWPAEHKSYAQTLRMFSVRQPFSMLIAAHRKLNPADFEILLRSCVMISLRYNVIGNLPTNEQESTYHRVSLKISNSELGTAGGALSALAGIYPNDDVFRTAFSEKIIRTSNSRNLRIARYLLCALDKQAGGQDYDFESDTFNVEHVLPQHPQIGWSAFSNEEADALCYRLGNMALLNRSDNRDLGNSEYLQKRPVLAGSAFVLTKKLADENAEWTPERIGIRQKALAKIATSVWRIAQLS